MAYSIIRFSEDRAGVYGDGMLRGNYGTAMVFDGTPEACQEWLELLRSERKEGSVEAARFKELSLASGACPYCKPGPLDETPDEIYRALIV